MPCGWPVTCANEYETIYFPAQRIHFAVDMPELAADEVIVNDPRITPWVPVSS